MIDAKELRKGNILMFDETDTVIVTEIYKKKVKFSGVPMARSSKREATCGLSDLEPVPITESILLMCGFSYSQQLTLWGLGNGNVIFEYDYEEEDSCNYFIHFYHNVDYLIVESSNDHGQYSNMKFKHIKFLHQLQNIYFSLTGEELEIKF